MTTGCLSDMDNNLSKYRLNDESELLRFKKDPIRFFRFVHSVYTLLDELPPGGTIRVLETVKPDSREIFVKVVCLYIRMEHRTRTLEDDLIEFSEDYLVVYRRPGIRFPEHWRHFYSR